MLPQTPRTVAGRWRRCRLLGGFGAIPNIRDVRNLKGKRGSGGPAIDERLGAMMELPNPTLIEQLDLPKEQGMVLCDVLADSAAAKAGLKPHDILLELNGQPVP